LSTKRVVVVAAPDGTPEKAVTPKPNAPHKSDAAATPMERLVEKRLAGIRAL
jgi:hypothetical protein